MGPCGDLITDADLFGVCDASQYDDDSPPSDQQVATAVSVASAVAWRLAGRRHGTCTVTGERPARMSRNNRCLDRSRWCACPRVHEVRLGNSPVQTVTEVRVAGVALAADAWRFVKPDRLIRRDGARWPACQLLHLPHDGVDVVAVDYTWGVPVDDHATFAIASFACELVKAMLPDPDAAGCRLPQAVQSVTRQGVTVDVVDPFDFLTEGRTGVYEFDAWLAAVNPGRMPRRSRVQTPDVAPAVVAG